MRITVLRRRSISGDGDWGDSSDFAFAGEERIYPDHYGEDACELFESLWKIGIVKVETVLRSGFGKGLWTREADV